MRQALRAEANVALAITGDCWLHSKDGDPLAYEMYLQHYSARPGLRLKRQFVGPGEKMVLVTPAYDALFVWRYSRFAMAGQVGVNCAVFRNTGPERSSSLILAAEQEAWQRWPGMLLFTFVDAAKIKSSNPGYCFLKAGWRKCGVTDKGLIILDKLPSEKGPTLYD